MKARKKGMKEGRKEGVMEGGKRVGRSKLYIAEVWVEDIISDRFFKLPF